MQRFYASPTDSFTWPNEAVGYRPGGPFDCLGPYAKVKNCPVRGTDKRYTVYATGYPDTYFSIPAHTRIRGTVVKGFFMLEDGNIVFIPYTRYVAHVRGA